MALSIRSSDRLGARDTAKFGLLTALAAIFIDAVVAHGLFWDNDPYWTYWITKTFLIATVFIFGTAFLGIGILQGLILTAVHTAILEVYYQWLAPVGLPQEPEWLDFNHLWVTGVPVHYLAILIGYFIALWIWRRDVPARTRPGKDVDAPASSSALAVSSLVAIVIILVVSGILTHALLLGAFPGITYFVQHLLVGFVFVFVWSAYVGMGGGGWIVGALMLSLTWTAYGIYVGPTGLPDKVHYLGYHDLWLRAFPGDFVAALLGLFVTVRFLPRLAPRAVPAALAVLACLVLPVEPADAKASGLHASASAQGGLHRVTGPNPVDFKSVQPGSGTIALRVVEGGNRWSHVQNSDAIDLVADFTGPDGAYRVVVDTPMPRHPHGRYTTWNGVVFDHQMHGDTGIGTAKLPLMKPDISLYGWGKVWRNGELISAMAPVHAMVTRTGAMPGVMLEVDTEDKALVGAPDGYITVHWPAIATLAVPKQAARNREIIGWIGLLGLALLFGWLAYRARPPRETLKS